MSKIAEETTLVSSNVERDEHRVLSRFASSRGFTLSTLLQEALLEFVRARDAEAADKILRARQKRANRNEMSRLRAAQKRHRPFELNEGGLIKLNPGHYSLPDGSSVVVTDRGIRETVTSGTAQIGAKAATEALGLSPKAASPNDRTSEPANPAHPVKGDRQSPPKQVPK